jgi:hypothetical protein
MKMDRRKWYENPYYHAHIQMPFAAKDGQTYCTKVNEDCNFYTCAGRLSFSDQKIAADTPAISLSADLEMTVQSSRRWMGREKQRRKEKETSSPCATHSFARCQTWQTRPISSLCIFVPLLVLLGCSGSSFFSLPQRPPAIVITRCRAHKAKKKEKTSVGDRHARLWWCNGVSCPSLHSMLCVLARKAILLRLVYPVLRCLARYDMAMTLA